MNRKLLCIFWVIVPIFYNVLFYILFIYSINNVFLQWTTDQDIYDCITSIGVSDLIDVKFFENDISGQSKGFCIITLHSEYSVKLVLNILPKEKLYGKSPIVTHMSIEAYSFVTFFLYILRF